MSRRADLRITKTYKALFDAMFTLLSQRSFNGITINDLCAEALISRATFYTHFNDKYDLFRYFSMEVRKNIIKDVYNYEGLEKDVNLFISVNKKLIKNVLSNADSETLTIIRDFMSAIVSLNIKRERKNDETPNHITFFNFIVGGLVNHLTWMVAHNFPPEVTMINTYLYKMLENLTAWDAEQE